MSWSVGATTREEEVRDEKEPNVHHIKCQEIFFHALINDKKTFELRKADRDYKVDDMLQIYEHEPDKGFSGRYIAAEVTYMMQTHINEIDYVIMSLKVCSKGNIVWAEHVYNQNQPHPTSKGNKEWPEKNLVKADSPAVRGPS